MLGCGESPARPLAGADPGWAAGPLRVPRLALVIFSLGVVSHAG